MVHLTRRETPASAPKATGTWRRAAAGAIGVLLALGAGLVGTARPVAAAPVRILPLGDSITAGYNIGGGDGLGGGYRIELEDDLGAAGVSFDFVGSLTNGPASLADKNHEGWNGYTITGLRQSVVPVAVPTFDPDIVLVMAGTNDLKAQTTPATPQQAANNLAGMLQEILTLAPASARVVVATLPPQSDPAANTRVGQFNALLPGVVSAAGPRVSLVDVGPVPVYDGLHPTTDGYRQIGNVFSARVIQLLTGGQPPPPGTWFGSLTPARLLDSRTVNSTVDGLDAGMGLRPAGSITEVTVSGRGGVPTNATAAVLNVTAAGPTEPGFATVFPCGEPVPTASNLNVHTGQDIPNAVVAKIGANGKVCIYTDTATHLIADVDAWFTATTTFGSLTPARLLDSRTVNSTVDGLDAGMGLRPAGSITELRVSGRGGVPTNATAAVLNVTAAGPTEPGFATVFPCGEPVPTASNLNFHTGQDIPNAVVAKIGANGKVCIYTDTATHLIADVDAWFS
jgi:lysophospholipase L1-like esterase